MPTSYRRLVDPMVGSAALFFHLGGVKALLGDMNGDLLNYYRALRLKRAPLLRELSRLRASRTRYYAMRSASPRSAVDRAVRFAYLNRLCWNGVYRVNRKGEFNVPIGSRLPKRLWSADHLTAASRALRTAKFIHGDFSKTLGMARRDDFVFLDPPYPRGTKSGLGFNRYSPSLFEEADHRRVSAEVRRLTKLGARVMVVIANRRGLLSLYPSDLNRRLLRSRSLISCNGGNRRGVGEVILRNYRD